MKLYKHYQNPTAEELDYICKQGYEILYEENVPIVTSAFLSPSSTIQVNDTYQLIWCVTLVKEIK